MERRIDGQFGFRGGRRRPRSREKVGWINWYWQRTAPVNGLLMEAEEAEGSSKQQEKKAELTSKKEKNSADVRVTTRTLDVGPLRATSIGFYRWADGISRRRDNAILGRLETKTLLINYLLATESLVGLTTPSMRPGGPIWGLSALGRQGGLCV